MPQLSEASKSTADGLLNKLNTKPGSGASSADQKHSNAELLGFIYHLMLLKDKDERAEYEELEDIERTNQDSQERRHREIVSALSNVTPSNLTLEKVTEKEPKSKKTKEKKPKKIKSVPLPKVKTASKNGAKPKRSSSSGLFSKPSGSSGLFSGGTKVAAGVAVAAGMAGIATSVGAAESGGNYDATFGDRTKNGKTTNVKGYISTQEAFGKPLTDMTLEEVQQFGRMRNAKSPNSGAVGKYQFIPSTLFGRNTKNGFVPGLVQELKLDMKSKFTAQLQDTLYNVLREKNVKSLTRLGVPITPGYEYMAHYIGPAGAAAVYNNRDKDMTVAQALVASGLPEPGKENNPELYTIKTANFETVLTNRLSGKISSSASPDAINQGDKINNDSEQNTRLKASTDTPNRITNNNTNQINTTNGQAAPAPVQFDDRPAYERKTNK